VRQNWYNGGRYGLGSCIVGDGGREGFSDRVGGWIREVTA